MFTWCPPNSSLRLDAAWQRQEAPRGSPRGHPQMKSLIIIVIVSASTCSMNMSRDFTTNLYGKQQPHLCRFCKTLRLLRGLGFGEIYYCGTADLFILSARIAPTAVDRLAKLVKLTLHRGMFDVWWERCVKSSLRPLLLVLFCMISAWSFRPINGRVVKINEDY